MTTRLTISLFPDERDALRELAIRERREVRDQAALIIRDELARLGLMAATDTEANGRKPDAGLRNGEVQHGTS